MELSQGAAFCQWLFYFFKNLLHFKNIVCRIDLMYHLPKCPYSFFFKCVEVLFEGAFSLMVSLKLSVESHFYLFVWSSSFFSFSCQDTNIPS